MDTLKQLFFSQYYGQKILYISKSAIAIQPNTAGFWNMAYDSAYIVLRPIEDLTDDEKYNLAHLCGFEVQHYSDKVEKGESMVKLFLEDYHLSISAYQYLLKQGVLLGFTYVDNNSNPITLTATQIVVNGWVKVI